MTSEQKREAIDLIYGAIETNGLIPALYAIFGKRLAVKIPMNRLTCDTPVEELELTVRSYNCLRRTNVNTVGQLADLAMAGDLMRLRNLGAISCREIQTKLLTYAYREAPVAWRKEFIEELIDSNLSRGVKSGK